MTPFLPDEEATIDFFTEEGGQDLAPDLVDRLPAWIARVIQERNGQLGTLNYIFCGDDYLLKLNQEYLQHDTLTDIITFPMEEAPIVSGDIFISTERVADNAKDLQVTYTEELCRVMIHGVLHLCGQGDKSPAEATAMRRLEDWALGLLR